MANAKISQLTANTNPTGNEELVYAYNNTNGKMTLNTMKTFTGTGKQDTLVSGTNIKTINNQSILGPGNIDIQGGGGGGGEGYDAIVDAGGQGDYTTIGAAIDDNKRTIFVRNGTYSETEGHFITFSAVDNLTIHGETKTGVVVNVELDSVVSQWSEPYSFPAYIFIDESSANNSAVDIKNITFNISIDSNQYEASLLRTKNASKKFNDKSISDCVFNVSNDGSATMDFNLFMYTGQRPYGTYDISNCDFIMTSNTATLGMYSSETIANEMAVYKNCYFLGKAANSNKGYIRVNHGYDCNIEFNTTGMGSVSCGLLNSENCYVNIPNKAGSVAIQDCTHCIVKGGKSATALSASTTFEPWAESTAYTTSDYVQYGGIAYKCNTAHTSGSSFIIDKSYWDEVCMFTVSDIQGCIIDVEGGICGWGNISNNSICSSYNECDLVLTNGAIFEGNYLYQSNYNSFITNGTIFNGNYYGDGNGTGSGTIYYNNKADHSNIITNNILKSGSSLSAIGSSGGSVVDNNAYL